MASTPSPTTASTATATWSSRIADYFRPHLRKMVVVAVAIVLTSLVDTGLPILISRGIDQLQQDRTTDAAALRHRRSRCWRVRRGCFNFVRRWLSSQVIGDVVLKVREDAFDAVLKRDLSFYDAIPSGKIVSRVTSDTQAFSNVVTLTLDLMSQLLLIVLLIGYLFLIDVRLTLITLALAPLIIVAALSFRRIARKTVTQSRRVRAVVSAHIQETVSGIGVAKTFRQEHAIYDEFLDVNQQSYRVNLRTNFVFSRIFPILNIIAGVGTAVLVYFGGESARAGAIIARQLVSVHPGDRAVLVPADQHRLVLEPVPAWAGGGRARVRADRRRAEGRADRQQGAANHSRRDRASTTWTSATTTTKPVLEDFSLTSARARRWRWSGTPARASRASASWSGASTSFRAGAS